MKLLNSWLLFFFGVDYRAITIHSGADIHVIAADAHSLAMSSYPTHLLITMSTTWPSLDPTFNCQNNHSMPLIPVTPSPTQRFVVYIITHRLIYIYIIYIYIHIYIYTYTYISLCIQTFLRLPIPWNIRVHKYTRCTQLPVVASGMHVNYFPSLQLRFWRYKKPFGGNQPICNQNLWITPVFSSIIQ